MNASNNILHLMGMDSTKYGGIEHFNVELSRQLAERGFHNVFVYDDFPASSAFVYDLQATGAEIFVIDSRHHVFNFATRLWRLLRRYDFCLMHAHFTKARFYAVPLALLYGISNIVYTLHSAVPPLRKIKPHTRAWYALFNRFCRVIAVSHDIERVSKQNWPDISIKKLYLGINSINGNREQSRREINISTDAVMVLCIANFNQIKGLDILVEAVAKMNSSNMLQNVVFCVVGQTETDKVELQRKINEIGVASHIRLIGISNQIPIYVTAADVYVQPSRSEGLPLALMEACSAGLPIVASRVGGIPEVAVDGKNAILFEAENIDACADALIKMISHKNLRDECGIQSQKIYTEKFQLKSTVKQLINYYQL